MALTFESECQRAVDLAKRAVPEGGSLEVGTVLAALCHDTEVARSFPELAKRLPAPVEVRPQTPERVNLSEPIQPVFKKLLGRGAALTVRDLLVALADSQPGRAYLSGHGIGDEELDGEDGILRKLERSPGPPTDRRDVPAGSGWLASEARTAAMEKLAPYRRMLTNMTLPDRHMVERDRPLQALVRTLHQMGRRNAILTGLPGTGKTALVYELARWMRQPDLHPELPPLPAHIRNADIFELSPVFLRSGASMVGEYDERVKTLLGILAANPSIILFVDEIHSLLQSGIHNRGAFSDANEAFKAALGHKEITCIGCTTMAEYRRFIEPDRALSRRFALVPIDPLSRNATITVLGARLGKMRAHYARW